MLMMIEGIITRLEWMASQQKSGKEEEEHFKSSFLLHWRVCRNWKKTGRVVVKRHHSCTNSRKGKLKVSGMWSKMRNVKGWDSGVHFLSRERWQKWQNATISEAKSRQSVRANSNSRGFAIHDIRVSWSHYNHAMRINVLVTKKWNPSKVNDDKWRGKIERLWASPKKVNQKWEERMNKWFLWLGCNSKSLPCRHDFPTDMTKAWRSWSIWGSPKEKKAKEKRDAIPEGFFVQKVKVEAN